jgi:hypothetical protein
MYSIDKSNSLLVATWNVAAINNNPFEYWVTYPKDEYNEFMMDVEEFIASDDKDPILDQIFTSEMFSELLDEMREQNILKLDEVTQVWSQDYKNRRAIRGFLQDKSLGDKRLTSMPDRITNTINLADGRKLLRPTVINGYRGPTLSSMAVWWREWRVFMFHTPVRLFHRGGGEDLAPPQLVCNLVGPIHRNKYPAISAAEQARTPI